MNKSALLESNGFNQLITAIKLKQNKFKVASRKTFLESSEDKGYKIVQTVLVKQ